MKIKLADTAASVCHTQAWGLLKLFGDLKHNIYKMYFRFSTEIRT